METFWDQYYQFKNKIREKEDVSRELIFLADSIVWKVEDDLSRNEFTDIESLSNLFYHCQELLMLEYGLSSLQIFPIFGEEEPSTKAKRKLQKATQRIEKIDREQLRLNIPDFNIGDIIAVHIKTKECGVEHAEVFRGVVIENFKRRPYGNFTVRKVSDGIGVERSFFIDSPSIKKIEVLSRRKPRSSRAYYVKTKKLRQKAFRMKNEPKQA